MRSYYLWTIGCQMNDADAATVQSGLRDMGFLPVSAPMQADLILLITCVVRQSAEDRVVGRLSSLKHVKLTRPQTVIAVMGCFVGDVAALQERFLHVDAFFRPSDVAGLMEFVRTRVPAVAGQGPTQQPAIQPVCAYVPIAYGCDHRCAYCIVRLRRGAQQSRPLRDILAEVGVLAESGMREVTFLGQNVDGYGQDLGPGAPDLADLVAAAHPTEGLRRIRFLTSHPGEMSGRLIRAVASLPKVCPHFELPVQSGDDRILKRMGRHYGVAGYRALVAAIREQIPGCSIATDVIVGFPGESEAQFQSTYDLLAAMRFDAVHIARYSPRPGTAAARLADDIPAEGKERRRVMLEELQKLIAGEINAALLGQTVEVLVEERQRGRWKGRTVTNKLVFFEDDHQWRGRLARVQITSAGPWSLRGELARPE